MRPMVVGRRPAVANCDGKRVVKGPLSTITTIITIIVRSEISFSYFYNGWTGCTCAAVLFTACISLSISTHGPYRIPRHRPLCGTCTDLTSFKGDPSATNDNQQNIPFALPEASSTLLPFTPSILLFVLHLLRSSHNVRHFRPDRPDGQWRVVVSILISLNPCALTFATKRYHYCQATPGLEIRSDAVHLLVDLLATRMLYV